MIRLKLIGPDSAGRYTVQFFETGVVLVSDSSDYVTDTVAALRVLGRSGQLNFAHGDRSETTKYIESIRFEQDEPYPNPDGDNRGRAGRYQP
jgi:hypothetical protein